MELLFHLFHTLHTNTALSFAPIETRNSIPFFPFPTKRRAEIGPLCAPWYTLILRSRLLLSSFESWCASGAATGIEIEMEGS